MTQPTRRIRLHAQSTYDGKGLAELRDDQLAAAKATDELGESMGRTETDARSLTARIAATKKEIRELGEEFERTGDRSLFADLGKQRRLLAQLEKIAKEGGEVVQKSFFDFGGKGIRPRNALIAGVVGLGAVLSPLIGGMIGGAVVGAVGTGGMVGGIAAASKDPRVRSAAREFGSVVTSEFFRSGDGFVEPTVEALRTLSSTVQNLDLAGVLAKGAPSVGLIAKGISDLATNTMPGLNRMLERSPQAAAIAARGFSDMGDAVSEMLYDIAETEGSMEGLRALFDITNGTIRVLGNTVSWLGDRFLSWNKANQAVSGSFEDIAEWWPLLIPMQKAMQYSNDQAEKWMGTGENVHATMTKVGGSTSELTTKLGGASDSWNAYAGQVEIVRKHQEQLNDAMEKSISVALALDNANLGLQQAMLDLGEELKDNGRDWRTNTQAGIDNRRALLNAVEAAERKRQADLASGKSADEANAAYQRTIDKLIAMAKRAGITEDALKDLVGDYNVNVHYRTTGSIKYPGAVLERKGRAHGGHVVPGEEYAINEHLHSGRPVETVTFGPGGTGTVHPARLTPAGGGRSIIVNVYVAPGADLREAGRQTVQAIQAYERANGPGWRS